LNLSGNLRNERAKGDLIGHIERSCLRGENSVFGETTCVGYAMPLLVLVFAGLMICIIAVGLASLPFYFHVIL
jgi:hypothetical protein